MTGTQSLLCEMLSCGTLDLELLDRVGYDWDEVLEQLDWPDGEGFNFNRLMRAIVDVGIIHIKQAVEDRICELEAVENERELDGDEAEEMESLRRLDPDQDIEGFFNCLDTHVWFRQNGSIYRRYLSSALDSFEDNVGFFLTGGEDDV